jgi:ParB-like chromosome segregation protein Spo0J
MTSGGDMSEEEVAEWSGEELLDLEEETLSPEVLLLDPNNPRLLEAPLGAGEARIADEIAADPVTQDQLSAQLRREEEVQSLVTRIKSMGFVSSFERIVVRPAKGIEGQYVVLEGNRRVAAVKTIKNNRAQYLSLSENVRSSIDAIQVVVYAGDDPDVAWQIQGFRNVGGGIKEWKPYQKARYIVDLLHRTGQGRSRC